jgi:hypothetical protein
MAWRLAGGGLPLAVCLLLAAVQLSQQHGLLVRPSPQAEAGMVPAPVRLP